MICVSKCFQALRRESRGGRPIWVHGWLALYTHSHPACVNNALGVALALPSVLPQSSSAAVSTRCAFAAWVTYSRWQCAMQLPRSQTLHVVQSHCQCGRAVFFHWLVLALARHISPPPPPLPFASLGRRQNRQRMRTTAKPRWEECSFAFGAQSVQRLTCASRSVNLFRRRTGGRETGGPSAVRRLLG